MKKILISIVFIFPVILSGCKKDPMLTISPEEEEFLTKTAVGVYSATSAIFTYSNDDCHYSIVPAKSCRIQKDDMSVYVNINLKNKAVPEQVIEAELKAAGITAVNQGIWKLKVALIDSDKIWFWAEDKKIGFLMPWEE